MNSDQTGNYFFGDQTMTSLPRNDTCRRTQTKLELVPSLVLSEEGNSSCVVFVVEMPKAKEAGLEIHWPYYRQLFESNDSTRSMVRSRWERGPTQSTPAPIHVAVHIRRGDLHNYLKEKPSNYAEARLVHESMYMNVLNQLLRKLLELGKFEVNIRLYCEGMKPPAKIPGASNWTLIDFKDGIDFFVPSVQNVTIEQGPMDGLQAWDDMCFSDILVTGASGFSYLASILCSSPLILAVPFWHSYSYLPNAMMLSVERTKTQIPWLLLESANLITSASFNETEFDSLWQEKNSPSTV